MHAEEHQFCLAHLIRDAQYAIDHGDTIFAPDFKALLKAACAVGRPPAPHEMAITQGKLPRSWLSFNSPAKPPATPERIEAVLRLRDRGNE